MDVFIHKMRLLGWSEGPDGKITHSNLLGTFDNWSSAILACIEVASE